MIIEEQQRQVYAREWQRREDGGYHEVEPGLQAGLKKSSPHRLLPKVDHDDRQHDQPDLLDQDRAEVGGMQRAAEDQTEHQSDHRQAKQHHQPPADAEPPTKHPSKQRAQSGHPSVIQVTHRAVGSKINSVEASAKTSIGRLAPGMTPWKARTGMDNSSHVAPSTMTKKPVSGRRATQPLNPVN